MEGKIINSLPTEVLKEFTAKWIEELLQRQRIGLLLYIYKASYEAVQSVIAMVRG